MKKIARLVKGIALLAVGAVVMTSCGGGLPDAKNPGKASTATGMAYNEDNGFQVKDYAGQPEAPNLVFIEGGRMVMGSFEEDLLKNWDNIERTVSVASFWMDETEIANVHWLEYMFYTMRDSSPEFYQSTLPDTNVWASELAYNDPYVEHYLRYPGFRYFPVVGVSWSQAEDYCIWRTNVVNNNLAKAAGVEVPENSGGRIPLETGVVVPNYRLPSEAEWQYASQAMIGNQWLDENQTHNRIYPWDGHALRNPFGKQMGMFLANFKRGRGDYAGIAGKLNDGAMITSYIYEFPPNDFGLYNTAGNVNEWVKDTYRPLSYTDDKQTGGMDDLNPLRRNGYLDEEGTGRIGSKTGYDKAGFQSLVDNNSKVYKGGSWKDVAYWLSPGTRRFIDKDSATATIGFRCAMIQAGTN